MSTPAPSASNSEESLGHDYSSGTSSWESDVSVGNIFRELSVNMVSTSHLEDKDEEMIQSDIDPWIKDLNTLWDTRFEQHEPPTKDMVVQINLVDETNPKPIFISDGLSPSEKKGLISLVQEYIDVFAWNYEDMLGLDPRVAMHRLNINTDVKPVKQQQRWFRPEVMEVIQSEVRKLIDSGFIREEQHPDWVANIVPVAKKNEKI